MLTELRRLCDHARWADHEVLAAVAGISEPSAEVLRELAHITAAEEVWLARLEMRVPRVAVWPSLSLAEIQALASTVHDGFALYLSRASESSVLESVAYTNSAGLTFRSTVVHILLQVLLHGQYHRGKVNLMLRQGGESPAPVDFIAFVRGVPAARQRRDAGE